MGVLTRFPLYLFGLKKPKRMSFQSLTQQRIKKYVTYYFNFPPIIELGLLSYTYREFKARTLKFKPDKNEKPGMCDGFERWENEDLE